ncbi:MAG: hypothetical protein IJD04_04880 [Desulfovibrionaceae bacterium]|nr:hypothetical protein [Desulfovibrionaceae bacterium]
MMELSHELIRNQLSRIVESKDFEASVRLRSFLTFVVEEVLAGRGNEIKAYTIAVSVFGRNAKFDPLLDPIVRVEAGKLRKLLERYYLLNPNEPVIITIPLGNYIPLFRRNPNIQEAQKKDVVLPSESSSERPASTKYEEKKKRPLVLIIPPDNFSNIKEITGFTYGIAEDLLMRMDYSELFDVLFAPTIAAEGGADPFELVELAAESQARFILHGRVQSTDSLLRVYVSLTDASNRRRIWTERFDAALDRLDLLSLQDEISAKVWAQLADFFGVLARLLMQETTYLSLDSIGPYDASLLYGVWEVTWDRGNFERAKEALERNLQHEPYNPVLLGHLSRIAASDFQQAINSMENSLDMGMDLAKLAISRDRDYIGGHIALAHSLFVRCNAEPLEEALKIILDMPEVTPYAQSMAGFFSAMAFNLEQGLEIIERAARLNAVQPGYHHIVPFFYHFGRGNYDAALKETLLLNVPTNAWDPVLRILIYQQLGQQTLLRGARQRLFELAPEFVKYRDQFLKGLLFRQERVDMVTDILHRAGIG